MGKLASSTSSKRKIDDNNNATNNRKFKQLDVKVIVSNTIRFQKLNYWIES